MKKHQLGFTLIEIMVVVGLIGIFSAVLYLNYSDYSAKSRDMQRQSDLRIMQSAIELYNSKYGRYPEGCNGPQRWSGSAPAYECSSGNQYIVGLAPEFIPRLPQDPKLNGDNSGYVYATNAEGSVYILKARLTVETESVGYDHQFKSCDTDNTIYNDAVCNSLSSEFGSSRPSWCNPSSDTFRTSYAVWGGYAEENFSGPASDAQENTERILCTVDFENKTNDS